MSTKLVKKLNRLLPLVAIGTVADCQSILEPTNRFLVKAGLQILNDNKHQISGLDELVLQTGFKDKQERGYKITSSDLGFYFSPILNSSGRLSHAKLSIDSLINKNPQDSVSKLIQTNFERKQYVKDIMEEIMTEVLTQKNNHLIWVEGDWSKGVIGLVASRIQSEFQKPVVMVSVDGELATASLRSPEGYHLPKALKELPEDLLIKFGGHPQAAGFSANRVNLPKIREVFAEKLFAQSQKININGQSFLPENYDSNIPEALQSKKNDPSILWLKEEDITKDLLEDTLKMDPFGQDFPMPIFVFSIHSYEKRWLGANNEHIKITLQNQISVTSFNVDKNLKHEIDSLDKTKLWLLAKVSQNSWNGKTSLELIADKIYF